MFGTLLVGAPVATFQPLGSGLHGTHVAAFRHAIRRSVPALLLHLVSRVLTAGLRASFQPNRPCGPLCLPEPPDQQPQSRCVSFPGRRLHHCLFDVHQDQDGLTTFQISADRLFNDDFIRRHRKVRPSLGFFGPLATSRTFSDLHWGCLPSCATSSLFLTVTRLHSERSLATLFHVAATYGLRFAV
jgi:hypothetical protein